MSGHIDKEITFKMKKENINDDSYLIKRVKERDQDAFKMLMIKYQPRIYSALYGYVKSKEDAENISSEIELVFIALHGRGGEDGYVQDILEDKGILYTGSNPESCKIAMDKVETKKIWRDLLLPTPDFVEIQKVGTPEMKLTPYLSSENDITALDKTFVVKPSREGSSFGISIVKPGTC